MFGPTVCVLLPQDAITGDHIVMMDLKACAIGIIVASFPQMSQAQGLIGGLIESACGGCGIGRALDDLHEDALGNVLDLPARFVRESVVEVAGPALAEVIRHSRDDARRAGTQAIPRDIYRKMLSVYPQKLLDSVEYRIGQGNELSVQANSFRFGDVTAVALIDTVVFQSDYQARYNDILWAHELKHIEQYQRWGLTDFGKRYVRSARRVEEEAANAARDYAHRGTSGAVPPIWYRMPGGLKHVDANSTQVWGVNSQDAIYFWDDDSWSRVPGGLKQISIGSDGTLWGVNRDDRIWRWNGSSWDSVAGGLKYISVGSASNIWGVNSQDAIYRWNGSGWDRIPGGLKQISVAADGAVWGVNRNDQIYRHR